MRTSNMIGRRSKLYIVVFLMTLLVFVGTGQALAQDKTEYEKAMDLYHQKYEEYKSAHSQYVLKRAQYLRYETLTSKTEAFDATLYLLEVRDEVLINYLGVLKQKLAEVEGVGDENKSLLNSQVDEEVAWYTDHKTMLSSAASLEDLVKDSEEAEKRFNTQTSGFGYVMLSNVSSGDLVEYRERIRNILAKLKGKIERVKSEEREDYQLSAKKIETIDRWIFESENRIIRAEEKHLDAEVTATEMIIKPKIKGQSYNNLIKVLSEAKLLYKEAGSFLSEVIREIKIAEKQ